MPVKPGDERSGYSASPIGREGISTRTLETSLFLSRLPQVLPQLPPVQRNGMFKSPVTCCMPTYAL